MSRCFPYPPPGYCRTGAAYEALIESIKLQKETDKAKADRKKEKRAKKEKKEKKEKDKRKNDEKLKLQQNQIQDSHKSQKVSGFTVAQIKGTKTHNEILEKSDLTEEHGQPIKPSYSSDSTQNSNKRRRDDDALLPDDSPSHGKPIKIRFSKKQKGSDSSNSGEDGRLKTVPSVSFYNSNVTERAQSYKNNGVTVPLTQAKSNTSFERPKNVAQNGIRLSKEQSAKPILPLGQRKSDVDVQKSSRQQQQIASFVRPVVGQSRLEQEIPSSSLSRKSDVEVTKPTRQQQQIASFVRPVVSASQSRLDHEIPSSSVSRNMGVQGLSSGKQQSGSGSGSGSSSLKPVISDPFLNKPNPSALGKRPVNEATVPGTSGPVKPEKKKEVGLSRSEKKMMKKKAKYEKLLASWVPPVFQPLLPPVVDDDDDWLSRRTTAPSASICRSEVESSCCELGESDSMSLWQPRARFLAEADMHALPYTVPF